MKSGDKIIQERSQSGSEMGRSYLKSGVSYGLQSKGVRELNERVRY